MFALPAQLWHDRLADRVPVGMALGCPLPAKPSLGRYVRTCVLSSRHGGGSSGLVEPVLPGAVCPAAHSGLPSRPGCSVSPHDSKTGLGTQAPPEGATARPEGASAYGRAGTASLEIHS
jgi:hypothetical protein